MTKPIIGISANSMDRIVEASKEGIGVEEQKWQLVADDYIRAVERAGGIPLVLPITEDLDSAKVLWDKVDGIILTGGNDVNPIHYNERNSGKCGKFDNLRDLYDIALAKYAVEENKPFLGVCRGMQILNVSQGGSLHQDLSSAGFEKHSLSNSHRNEGAHFVKVLEGSLLHEIVGQDKLYVNSYHHQGLNKLADNIRKMAETEEDKLVEAIYVEDKNFVMGIQWHPEMMYDKEIMQKIVERFVESCK